MRTIDWADDAIVIIDQTALPGEERLLRLTAVDDLIAAIRSLAVRGAPALGVAGALGVALAVRTDAAHRITDIETARPTAVNLARGARRAAAVLAEGPDAVLAEALAVRDEEIAASAAMAARGADLIAELCGARPRMLTHCNTGALAAVTGGTALGVVLEMHRRGALGDVIASETRPLLQGARLTAWELDRAGVSHAIAVDSAVPGLIARGEVHAVVTGLDRVAANGDVVNKVGTYPLALAARAADIPFVAAGPSSSVDHATPTGRDIEIEERDAAEVRGAWSMPGTPIRNPAFDVTPAELVWALVTEAGVTRLPR